MTQKILDTLFAVLCFFAALAATAIGSAVLVWDMRAR